MAKKSDKPLKSPTYQSYIDSFNNSANQFDQAYTQHLDWAKTQGQDLQDLFKQVSGAQSFEADQLSQNALADRQRYENVAVPAQDRYQQEVNKYGTSEDMYRQAGIASADTKAALDATRAEQNRTLAGYGISEASTRGKSLDLQARIREAAQVAMAANQAAQQRELLGTQLRGGALSMYAGLPGQAAQEGATSAGIQQGITTEGNAVAQTANQLRQGAVPFGGLKLDAQKAATQTAQQAYQDTLSRFRAKNADMFTGGGDGGAGGIGSMLGGQLASKGVDSMAGGIGSIGGWLSSAGGWAGGALDSIGGIGAGAIALAETGGPVDELKHGIPTPEDNVPVMMNKHEYVIPKDIVMRKGTEFFDRLIDKTRNPAPKKQGIAA